jgi:hypothetical protein
VSRSPTQAATGGWASVNPATLRLRLDVDAAWSLVAAAGGSAITLFGEWDGESLRPLSAWTPELIWTADTARSDR